MCTGCGLSSPRAGGPAGLQPGRGLLGESWPLERIWAVQSLALGAGIVSHERRAEAAGLWCVLGVRCPGGGVCRGLGPVMTALLLPQWPAVPRGLGCLQRAVSGGRGPVLVGPLWHLRFPRLEGLGQVLGALWDLPGLPPHDAQVPHGDGGAGGSGSAVLG